MNRVREILHKTKKESSVDTYDANLEQNMLEMVNELIDETVKESNHWKRNELKGKYTK